MGDRPDIRAGDGGQAKVQSHNIRQNLNTLHKFVLNLARINICKEIIMTKSKNTEKALKPMPFIAMVSSVGSNDEEELYTYLGGVKNDRRSEEFDAAFKQEKSNFHIVIVVDMWITGFDVPCLTYLVTVDFQSAFQCFWYFHDDAPFACAQVWFYKKICRGLLTSPSTFVNRLYHTRAYQ